MLDVEKLEDSEQYVTLSGSGHAVIVHWPKNVSLYAGKLIAPEDKDKVTLVWNIVPDNIDQESAAAIFFTFIQNHVDSIVDVEFFIEGNSQKFKFKVLNYIFNFESNFLPGGFPMQSDLVVELGKVV